MEVIAKQVTPFEFTYFCDYCKRRNKPVVHRHGNGTRSLDNRIENRLSHCADGGRSMIIHITDATLRKKK